MDKPKSRIPVATKPNSMAIGNKCSAKIKDIILTKNPIASSEPKITSINPFPRTIIAGGMCNKFEAHSGTTETQMRLFMSWEKPNHKKTPANPYLNK